MRAPTMALAAVLLAAAAAAQADAPATGAADQKPDAGAAAAVKLEAEEQSSQGSVTVGGTRIDYRAVAGTLVVPPKDLQDPDDGAEPGKPKPAPPQAAMSYVAYFKHGAADAVRPVTFLFNGGPGSSTVWLHMGAFGPRRVVTLDDSHTPAAPYRLVNNDYSLLDASDLVFIDAPGTGFGRIVGKDKEKAFYGVDADARAFAAFITEFLTKYGRWNSPKYLFGESYGTTRSAVLARLLQQDHYMVDLNGVILLSQILNFDNNADSPQYNPGVDLPYVLALPTYAATAWYHHKLPDPPASLDALLPQVEHFATTDYAAALLAGSTLDDAHKQAVAAQLHRYTGLPVDYLLKADLRVNGGEFEKNLQGDADLTTGRLDSRFSGPTMDPLSQEAAYDPQSAAIGSAYVSAFNDYVRKDLKFGEGKTFKPGIDVWKQWDFLHQPEGAPIPLPQATNVMPDLAAALKYNPQLKVQLNAGYFDLATPFYEGVYEMQHLPVPANIERNIEFRFYASGHMVYAHEPALKALHDNVADFIRRTDNLGGKGG